MQRSHKSTRQSSSQGKKGRLVIHMENTKNSILLLMLQSRQSKMTVQIETLFGVEATNIQLRRVRRSLPNRMKGAREHQYFSAAQGWLDSVGRRWKGWQDWTSSESSESLLSIGQLKTFHAIHLLWMRQKMDDSRPSTNSQNGWNLIYDLTSRDTMTELLSQ